VEPCNAQDVYHEKILNLQAASPLMETFLKNPKITFNPSETGTTVLLTA
jgi:hypothetical protein